MDGYRSIIICSLLLAITSGCHYRDPSIDLLEGELRYMEDQVYMLEGELHKRCAQLDSCQQSRDDSAHAQSQGTAPSQTYSLKTPNTSDSSEHESVSDPVIEMMPSAPAESELSTDPDPRYELIEPVPAYESVPAVEMPVDTRDLDTDDENGDDRVPTRATDEPVPAKPRVEKVPAPSGYEILDPEIEIPEGEDGSSLMPTFEPLETADDPSPSGEMPEGQRPLLQRTEDEFDEDDESDPSAPIDFSSQSTVEAPANLLGASIDANVTHVVARAEIVTDRGFDDEVTGADVLVVVEPRNQNGQYVELTGPVSVVVLDAAQKGEAARVARWDYDAGSARRAIRESALGRGIHLELNWPDDAPVSDNLHLFVRYTTVEDRRLESDVRLAANPGRKMSKGWQVVDRSNPHKSEASSASDWAKTKRTVDEKRSAVLSGFKLQPIPMAANDRASDSAAIRAVDAAEPLEPIGMGESVEPATTTESLAKPEWSPFR